MKRSMPRFTQEQLDAAHKTRLPADWRARYSVWCQAEGRDGDDREYAAECRDCKVWLLDTAGSRSEAWDFAKAHEISVHRAAGTPTAGRAAPKDGGGE